jgi:hypothetical protein
MRAWSICDRCGFKYYSTQMALESTGVLVCHRCNDGKYDLKRHPQNRPFRPRPELREIRLATTDDSFDNFLATEADEVLTTEAGARLLVTQKLWTPDMSSRL